MHGWITTCFNSHVNNGILLCVMPFQTIKKREPAVCNPYQFYYQLVLLFKWGNDVRLEAEEQDECWRSVSHQLMTSLHRGLYWAVAVAIGTSDEW